MRNKTKDMIVLDHSALLAKLELVREMYYEKRTPEAKLMYADTSADILNQYNYQFREIMEND